MTRARTRKSLYAAIWQLLRWPIFVLAALAGGAAVLLAQSSQLQEGARVRLRAPGVLSGEVEGAIVGRHGDTLVFAPRGKAPVRLAVTALTTAAIYRGRDRGAGVRKGALWGGGIGLALGAFNVVFSDCGGRFCDSGYKVGGALVFGALGAGVGGAIGAARGGDRWDALVLP